MACEQPDSGSNHPRNLFVWRSNLLGSSGKATRVYAEVSAGDRKQDSGRGTPVPATDQTGRS
ncbi:hypothetical protein DMI62_20420 [Escherichia coli]|nr:hypothetical protein [Escherichia coli]